VNKSTITLFGFFINRYGATGLSIHKRFYDGQKLLGNFNISKLSDGGIDATLNDYTLFLKRREIGSLDIP
jgi:hypothetical protein